MPGQRPCEKAGCEENIHCCREAALLMRDSASIGTGSLISVTSLANGYLHRAIMAGQCGENDVLRQEAIAEQLGASRVPVREALKQLESGGLVV
jgi:DNA-binding GntR family transcriptional regulator